MRNINRDFSNHIYPAFIPLISLFNPLLFWLMKIILFLYLEIYIMVTIMDNSHFKAKKHLAIAKLKIIFIVFALLCISRISYGQQLSKNVVAQLNTFVDQYNTKFVWKAKVQNMTLIYVPGSDEPFNKIYDRLKERKLKSENVQFTGGFKEVMAGASDEAKSKHLQEAFVFRYGKTHFSILLDIGSILQSQLSLTGYSVVTIPKDGSKKTSVTSYGMDRKKFLDAIEQYFKK